MKEDKKCAKCNPTYIGGQAVLEGVMMMGKSCMATAVRDPDGEIQIESSRLNKSDSLKTASKIPFVRGIVNLVYSLVKGIKTLMRSASVYGDEEDSEPGRVQKWFAERFKTSLMDVITYVSVFLGVLIAFGLFVFLPNFLVERLAAAIPPLANSPLYGLWAGLLLGAIKLIIFLGYLGAILALKSIRRLYQYHGAEHKTINAYEQGLELTPQNVAECSRIHDRCGTSFLFIVLIINVVFFSVVSWGCRVYMIKSGALKVLARLGLEVLLLPVIAGFSYEILKLLARFNNPVVNVFKAPGTLLQKYLTTREPDEKMIEVAIAAFNKVLEMDADETVPETKFVTSGILSKMLAATKKQFAAADIDESDAEWIYSLVLGVKRSDLSKERNVMSAESKRIAAIVEERLTGRPLWYIIGDVEFCNCKIKVDERALIPRPETEMLADITVRSLENNDKVLDMCTGSGCVAIAIAKATKGRGINVTGADVSDAAVMLARENAAANGVNVNFVVGDLFENIHGRYNVIVCNPPYIKTTEIPYLQREVREHEPRIALDGGEDGLEFYRRLSKEIKSYLTKDGMLILECGEDQASQILQIFPKRDYAMVLKDFNGTDRFLKIVF